MTLPNESPTAPRDDAALVPEATARHPRRVEDPGIPGLWWRIVGGAFETCNIRSKRLRWTTKQPWNLTPARVLVLADLVANPYESDAPAADAAGRA